MTQQPDWAAILAPIGKPGTTGQTIASDCVITVREGAPLFDRITGDAIGKVTGTEVFDGYLVATGTLHPGQDLPDTNPTFDSGFNDQCTFGPLDSDEPNAGTVTYLALEVNRVYAGYDPAWPDPRIGFTNRWCVHTIGPDDLIPMPDHAMAERAAARFNTWWQDYRNSRQSDGLDLPTTPARVEPWPYGEDAHSAALAELRDDDPDGWLTA